MRVGVFADLVYRRDDNGFSTDVPFLAFLLGLIPRVDELVLFGRLDSEPGRAPYAVQGDNVRVVALPHYPTVRHLRALWRARAGAVAAFRRELPNLDVAWLFGPHPLSLSMHRAARRAGTPVVLGIRQDFPQYVRGRLPNVAWRALMPGAHALEVAYRRAARRTPAIVVGDELARHYAGGSAPVLAIAVSLITDDDIVDVEAALARPWDGELVALSVGRLDPEKNPLLLADIDEQLRTMRTRWQIAVAGSGPLSSELARLDPSIRMVGHVAQGDALRSLYRSSHAFLHVSLTEGIPQVLYEAMAAGLPIVATDVGGVRPALDDGRLGLLMPPRRADLAARALQQLAQDAELRRRLVTAGLEHAATRTMDSELTRVVAFLHRAVGSA